MKIKIINIVGARPNFMKIAPLVAQMGKHPTFDLTLVHTGQHYDKNMSESFFEDLGIPRPDINLEVGSGSQAEQTAKIMMAFEKVALDQKPDLIVVVGDVNSTIACSLVAVKLGIKIAHVEAGLRSFDWTMPEEINRVLTDQISDFLFVTEPSGRDNLLAEGIDEGKIHFVGNVMIDTLLGHLERARESRALDKYGLRAGEYAALTLHRPSNVDSREALTEILDALAQIQERIPILFPIHPRSRARLDEFGLGEKIKKMPGLIFVDPLDYLSFLKLISEAKFVLTDSGGIQEETTVLGIPCLTLRDNTERPVTVSQGTNLIIGTDGGRIVAESLRILDGGFKKGKRPELWDGRAAERIVRVLLESLGQK